MARSVRLSAVFVTVVLGCSAQAPEEPSFGEAAQPIINGTPFSPEGLYYVSLHHGGPGNTSTSRPYNICSGTLIRNDAILTARHCVTFDRSVGGAIDSALGDFELIIGSQRSGVREIVDLGDDAALVISSRFFAMHGRNVGWTVPVYSSPSSTLVGRELFCFGYGVDSAAADPASADILRYAWIAPTAATATRIFYNPNSRGQLMFRGDSGGSCIYTGTLGTALEVTGVNTTCATSGTGPCSQVAPEVFRGVLESALSARAAARLHRTSTANRSGHITTLDLPGANDNPSAIVSATSVWNPGGTGGVSNAHPIGVYYFAGRWRIFNQDFATMPLDASFVVTVGGSVHRATTANTSGHITTIDHPALNGNPSASVIVTPNWNPPGSSGVYDNHAIGVYYSGGRWKIFNQDIAAMPIGASFNLRITGATSVRATSSTVSGNALFLDDPNLNAHPEANVLVTSNFNPFGSGARYLNAPLGTRYDTARARWAIFRQDGAAMPTDAGFNVLVRP